MQRELCCGKKPLCVIKPHLQKLLLEAHAENALHQACGLSDGQTERFGKMFFAQLLADVTVDENFNLIISRVGIVAFGEGWAFGTGCGSYGKKAAIQEKKKLG